MSTMVEYYLRGIVEELSKLNEHIEKATRKPNAANTMSLGKLLEEAEKLSATVQGEIV